MDKKAQLLELLKRKKAEKEMKFPSGLIDTFSKSIEQIRGKDGKDGEKGEKGDKGDKGEDGKDGQRGFVGLQGEKGKDGRDGIDGQDGKNGLDGIGIAGKDGKDGSPDTSEDIRNKLELLQGDDRLKLDSLSGVEKLRNGLLEVMNQGLMSLDKNKVLGVKSSGGTAQFANEINFIGATVAPNSNQGVDVTITGGGGSGVTSFNTRTGAVTLTSGDVTTALGYTPQVPVILTTTGSSGAATFDGTTLNIPNYTYTLPTASTSVLGGVKVDGTSITISGGVISATGGGSGTVTSVSVTTANGVSGTVATATTTPAITLTLGAITPTSVNSVVLSGSSTPTLAVTGTTTVSGSNTGDQTITLTGDVTGSGTGSFPTTIKSSVTLAGSPVTTTQTSTDNSTKIATTAFVTTAVQNALNGLYWKPSVGYATTANVIGTNTAGIFTYTSTGVDTIDGHTLALNDVVLFKNQTTQADNGVWVVTTAGAIGIAGVLTRRSDYNSAAQIQAGDAFYVLNGTVNATTTWVQTATVTTINTDPLTFVQASGPGEVTSGNGITITGNSVAINTTVTVDKTTAQALTNKDLTGAGNTFPTFNQNTTGSAATLTTPRAINGVNFDGSAAITVTAAAGTLTGTTLNSTVVTSSLTSVGTLASLSVTGNITNAALTASKVVFTDSSKNLTSTGIGTSSEFIKGDGSLDSSTYITANQTITLSGAVTGSGTTAITTTIATPGTLTASTTNSTATAHTHAITTATAPTASTIVAFDANSNLSANNLIEGFTTTATAAGTTVLTIASTYQQYFTGSTTQTVTLPTTSVVAGGQYQIVNNSTGVVTVQSSGANTILAIPTLTTAVFTALVATPTTAANWAVSSYPNTPSTGGAAYSMINLIYNPIAVSSGTSYWGPSASNSSTVSGAEMIIPNPGTLKNFYLYRYETLTGTSIVYTIYKNGSSTAITASSSGSGAATLSDTTHSITVAAGDRIVIQVVATSISSNTGRVSGASIEFDPTS